MSNGKVVDISNTDQACWDAQLEACGLGMNRGTTFPEEDLLVNEADRKARKLKSKGGRPKKPGAPKGQRPKLTKPQAAKASRATITLNAPGGMFQAGGFWQSSAKFHATGSGRRGGRRGPEGSRDFIQYVGNAYDLARLEESINQEETGRVGPSGYGPDR